MTAAGRENPAPIAEARAAETRLRRAMEAARGSYAMVRLPDLVAVLDEIRALRARNAALFREMGRPLPLNVGEFTAAPSAGAGEG